MPSSARVVPSRSSWTPRSRGELSSAQRRDRGIRRRHVSDDGGDRMRRILVLAGVVAATLALPATAGAARVAVGLAKGAEPAVVARSIQQRTGARPETLEPIPALVVEVYPSGVSLRGIRGVRYVEPLVTRHLAFTPTDPLAPKQWYLPYSGFYAPWVTLPVVRAHPGRGHRLGRRRRPSRSRREDPRCKELRRRIRPGRHVRPWDVRRRADRRRSRQRHRHRRARAVLRAPDREGRDQVALDSRRRRGAGDPLGGRQRRPGHQHEPRRGSGSARSRARHVLAPGGRRRRIRGLERRGRRRRSRQLGSGPRQPLEVRELSRRAPTCARCQRDERHGRDPVLLESRPHLQRSRGTRARDPLDSPAPPHGAFPAVQPSRGTRAAVPRSTGRPRGRRSPRRR